ncbi:HD domain-containing protein [Diaphorobacter aerolatus]|uniref:N-methyl-D-aspartate receptor NMDAR2C subunit n=1 Tax=Diaphorobacter aerolatus TaxID=1288495 RepID=A0A7H0GKY6_9BURK|nr:N-methyl-D-aspartate receptor NMDAR2C subunit [Diaphorobacter aerolatus]QNP48952.1 N-methyl-D-aspartate receptor NMDAR2C subunit [Diaphorobacter aerolatus]
MTDSLSLAAEPAGEQDVLARSWERAWRALGLAQPGSDAFEALMRAYAEPQRHYHSQQHLREALALLETVLPTCRSPGEVELALWYHDAIYDPKAKDNEARSAAWAARVLREQGASDEVISRVEALILATEHRAQPSDPDARLLVDVDLGILAAAPHRFAQYEQQVRAEYAWVPSFVYDFKRREVLCSFLSRPGIYATDHFRALFETRARANLEQALR